MPVSKFFGVTIRSRAYFRLCITYMRAHYFFVCVCSWGHVKPVKDLALATYDGSFKGRTDAA
jgi:hypothetical protein